MPRHFIDEPPATRAPAREETRDSASEEQSHSVYWHWFALAVLLFAWVAEATMCAERGF